jgi:hypothetical protein
MAGHPVCVPPPGGRRGHRIWAKLLPALAALALIAADAAPLVTWTDSRIEVSGSRLPTRPNPARFYTKIGEKADFWTGSAPATRDDVARFNEIVFIWDSLPLAAKAIADDLAGRRTAVGNPGLRILRYWNMWGNYNDGTEAAYTEEMYLYGNWPETAEGVRGERVVHAADGKCIPPALVDISTVTLQDEVARVLEDFLPNYDGVFFDRSGWDLYEREYAAGNVGLATGATCSLPAPSSGFAAGFVPSSGNFALGYHERMQGVLDPAGDGGRLHLCNGLPRTAAARDSVDEDRYLGVVDGCQMDTSFLSGSQPVLGADWLFQVNTLRRFAARGRYFLAKLPWSTLSGAERTNALEYGFATYLLGADGRYALVQPAFNFTSWATDPIVSAPLGAATGEMRLVPGAPTSTYAYVREFVAGLVFVNAGTGRVKVTLPKGTYRDVRRGNRVTGKITLSSGTARILVR